MDEMVERVALAMQEACEGPAGDFDKRPHETYVKCARAAIEAMRVPTEAMISAATIDAVGTTITQIIWGAMLEEALK